MRVLLLTHQFLPRQVGGTEMLVLGLARRLVQQGDEAVVMTYVESGSERLQEHGFRLASYEGIPVWELHWNLSIAPHPATAEHDNPRIAELVARAALEIRPDVVHAAHLMKFSAAVIPRLKAGGIPVVATLSDFWALCLRHTLLKPDGSLCTTGPDHDLRCLGCAQATHRFAIPLDVCENEAELHERAARALKNAQDADAGFRNDVLAMARRKERILQALAQADRIIALSAFQQRLFLAHGYPADRLGLALHGVETAPLEGAREARRGIVRHQTPRRVVFMGTLVAQKGLHILIEALGLARDAHVRLEVYGADGSDPEYNRRVHSLGASDPRITFHGVLEKERLGDAFVGAAALAAPALWYENEPLTPKSALYCGVPVAASRIGSLAEMVSDPDDGWLLPPGEPQAWAEWLSMLADADHLPAPTGQSVPSADDFADQMFRTYRELNPATGHA